MEFSGHISSGKLTIHNRDGFLAWVKTQPDMPIKIEVSRRKRSLAQNAFYWGAVLPLVADSTGHAVSELHDAFKSMFLGRRVIDIAGKEVIVTASSAVLDTKEFSEYVDRVTAWAATELGIIIPPPGEYAPQGH